MLTYQLAYAWFGRAATRWAGMLFMFSPLAWFHGTVALICIAEAAMAALVDYLCWLTWRGRHAMIIPAAIAFSLAAGIRQSTALFLYVPLYTSQAGVTRNVQELSQIEQGIRAIAIPEKILVVVFEACFYGFHHLG